MNRPIRLFVFAGLVGTGICALWETSLAEIRVSRHIKPDKQVTLMAVGDIMLDRGLRKKMTAFGPDYPFELIRPILKRADLAMGNLECPLSDREFEVTQQFRFRAHPKATSALRKSGFKLLNLANNHALDCGQAGVKDTMDRLTANGIMWCGAGANREMALTPTRFEFSGIKIAVLGFCDFPPHLASIFDDQPTIAQTIKADMLKAIRDASREGAIVVVNFHWGQEQSTNVTSRQQDLANFAIDSGADIILGHHPHVLQPVEERTVLRGGTKRTCLIAWSLGNFVFDGHKEAEKQSMILKIEIGTGGVRGFKLLPIILEHSRPRLADGTTSSQ